MSLLNDHDDDHHDGVFSGSERRSMKSMANGGGVGCVIVALFLILMIVSIGFSAVVSSVS